MPPFSASTVISARHWVTTPSMRLWQILARRARVALTDVGHALAEEVEQGSTLREGLLRPGHDERQPAGLDHLAVAADRGGEERRRRARRASRGSAPRPRWRPSSSRRRSAARARVGQQAALAEQHLLQVLRAGDHRETTSRSAGRPACRRPAPAPGGLALDRVRFQTAVAARRRPAGSPWRRPSGPRRSSRRSERCGSISVLTWSRARNRPGTGMPSPGGPSTSAAVPVSRPCRPPSPRRGWPARGRAGRSARPAGPSCRPAFRPWIRPRHRLSAFGSRPSDGSSSSSSFGSSIRQRAISTIRRWPPERLPAVSRARSATIGNSSRDLRRSRSRKQLLLAADEVAADAARSRGRSCSGTAPCDCGTWVMPSARISAGGRPSMPLAGQLDLARSRRCSSPLIARSTVDLPAPLGPTMQVIVPFAQCEVDALQHVAAAVAGGDAARA